MKSTFHELEIKENELVRDIPDVEGFFKLFGEYPDPLLSGEETPILCHFEIPFEKGSKTNRVRFITTYLFTVLTYIVMSAVASIFWIVGFSYISKELRGNVGGFWLVANGAVCMGVLFIVLTFPILPRVVLDLIFFKPYQNDEVAVWLQKHKTRIVITVCIVMLCCIAFSNPLAMTWGYRVPQKYEFLIVVVDTFISLFAVVSFIRIMNDYINLSTTTERRRLLKVYLSPPKFSKALASRKKRYTTVQKYKQWWLTRPHYQRRYYTHLRKYRPISFYLIKIEHALAWDIAHSAITREGKLTLFSWSIILILSFVQFFIATKTEQVSLLLLGYFAFINITSFLLYWIDRRRSRANSQHYELNQSSNTQSRISESSLNTV